MATSEYLTSTDIRVGWIRAQSGAIVPINYANVDGWAVFEGCILLGKTEEMDYVAGRISNAPDIVTNEDLNLLGLAITNPGQKWPKVGDFYEVAYEMAPDLPNSDLAKSAIKHWEANTKIRFKPRGSASAWVSFVRGLGPASSVGRQGGQQFILLSSNSTEGNAIHEIGHTVGLWHEHSRPDRDDFIDVRPQNINPATRFNFDKQTYNAAPVGPYDFGSIMHYPDWAFSINNQPTIRPKPNPPPEIGQRRALSPGDIATIAALYP